MNSNKGNAVIIVVVILGVVGILTSSMFNSQNSHAKAIFFLQLKQTRDTMASSITRELNNYSALMKSIDRPGNQLLKNCLKDTGTSCKAYLPDADKNVDKTKWDFFEMGTSLDVSILLSGTESSPQYYDKAGNICPATSVANDQECPFEVFGKFRADCGLDSSKNLISSCSTAEGILANITIRLRSSLAEKFPLAPKQIQKLVTPQYFELVNGSLPCDADTKTSLQGLLSYKDKKLQYCDGVQWSLIYADDLARLYTYSSGAFRAEGGPGTVSNPQYLPLGCNFAGFFYSPTTGGDDGVMEFSYACPQSK